MTDKITASIISPLLKYTRPQGLTGRKSISCKIYFLSPLMPVICGADNWVAIEEFGEAKESWFTELLGLENGISSYDTFSDVFALIDTEEFSKCFFKWVADLTILTEGEVITIDGKCLRRHIDKASNKAARKR